MLHKEGHLTGADRLTSLNTTTGQSGRRQDDDIGRSSDVLMNSVIVEAAACQFCRRTSGGYARTEWRSYRLVLQSRYSEVEGN